VPRDLDALTSAQRAAVTHEDPGTPLLVLGGPGTGKTRVLVERFAWLVAGGVAPEEILLVGGAGGTVAKLRTQVEDAFDGSFGELAVHTVPDLAARLLREEPAAVGLDPFFVPVTAADRLALLLDRVDQLTLRRHDFRGNRSALLASVIERIDRCKLELVSAADYARWSEGLQGETAEREREFAQLFADHDRLLAEQGTLDVGDLVLRAIDLLRDPGAGARCRARFTHVLVDEYEDLDLAHLTLIDLLAEHGSVTVAGDDDAAIKRFRGAATTNLRRFTAKRSQALVIALERSFRSRERILTAAQAVTTPVPDRLGLAVEAAPGGDVAFWRCANERAQAQGVAAEVEKLVREGVRADRIAVLVRSVQNEGQAVTVALEERAVPFRVVGAAAFFQRAEVRDVLAWLRLLVDPSDANAFVRALARPPVELRAADLARCIQIARRRKLDMVGALVAATESPQLPPEARERILAFLKLHRKFVGALDTTRPDLFVHRLVERLGLRRQQLFAANADVVERLTNLARLGELAAHYVRRAPQATPREFARSIAAVAEAGLREEEPDRARGPRGVAVMTLRSAKGREFDHVFVLGLHSARMPGARRHAYEPLPDALLSERLPPDSRAAHVAEMRRLLQVGMTRATRGLVLAYPERSDRGALQLPSPFVEEARAALGAEFTERAEQLFGPDETLHATYRQLRDELLEEVPRVGTRLGELRFDTDLDVAHGTVRYLELLKIAALLERPAGQSVAEALPNVNARLFEAVTAQQKDLLLSSSLDEALLEAERDERARAASVAARAEPSLEPFLPKRCDGLMLSASDIETYRTCPLKYKFARVFRIPQEPTLNQRFGIAVHQVLERYHVGGMTSLDDMVGLLESAWRRGGFGYSDEERQLLGKARAALERYWNRWRDDPAEPVWFERQFSFRLGPHMLRGRVDRVDRLPDGGYELIDYKTGRPKTPAQLRDDVQLALYALAASEAWDLEASQQSYLYVLDDEKVPLPPAAVDRDWVADTVMTVGEGILAQGFEPTPSYAACSMCDYRIVCPAAER
jgi:DNA helicase II / ATP-dependent DNA helicase PcrA